MSNLHLQLIENFTKKYRLVGMVGQILKKKQKKKNASSEMTLKAKL